MSEFTSQSSLSRKEREQRFRLNIVLDAAEEVFADASYAASSVEEIARRAEISVGTLYNLFRSKEDIYRAVVSRAQESFFEEIEKKVDEARGPLEQVHVVVNHFFEHFTHYSRQFRLYLSATNGFQWELKSKLVKEAERHQRDFLIRFVEVCQRGIDEGIFKAGIAADLMAITVLGIPHSFLMYWVEQEGMELMSLRETALKATDRVTGVAVD